MVAAIQNEANVIDDELLAQALVEEEVDGRDKMKNMGLPDVILQSTSLKLSFRHIRKVDNLQGFRSLTRLCLDNNQIQKIENIDFLVNLVWLDLSFNHITKIEGLEKLTKLTDLSLFNNRIKEVEGLDQCVNLQCLSIGNNLISTFDSITRLRRFERLQLLNLEGNPVCKESDYRMMVLAYLSQLKYLDYSMVQKDEIVATHEQFQSELIDLEKKDAIERDKANIEHQAAMVSAQLASANLQVVECLFTDMFRDDAEMLKLKYLPGIQDFIEQFRNTFVTIAEGYKNNGLNKYTGKLRQVENFEKAVKKLRDEDVKAQREFMEGYVKMKKKTFHALGDILQPISNATATSTMAMTMALHSVQLSDLEPLKAELQKLYDQLLGLEVLQVDRYEDLINEFETKYGEIKNSCLDLQQAFFRAVEDQEARFTQSLVTHASDLLEKAANDGLPEDITEEAENLLIDRDSLMETITGAHDNRVSVLLKKEDEARAREDSGYTNLISRYREDEKVRNRNRVMELRDFMDKNNRQIVDLVNRNQQEDFDDHDGS